jgi:hypothetical protein
MLIDVDGAKAARQIEIDLRGAGHYGPSDGWQIRHAFRFLARQSGLRQADSVVESPALN